MNTEDFDTRVPLISIVTATFNKAQDLPRLIESLRSQTNKNFEWVVADGGSTDGTLEQLKQVLDMDVVLDSRPDFGIYDALNRAIELCSGDYYLVVGADDMLNQDAIELFYISIEKNSPDFVSALVRTDCGSIISPEKKWKWFYSQRAYIGAHAVGTLIKKSLHDSFGFYSKDFPIAADQFFVRKACDAGARISYSDFISGIFGTSGVSNIDCSGMLTESFRVQLRCGENKFIQIALLLIRLIKNFKKL
ncbi:Glycosyltransferase involved in cell wall bisynthesis [Desulfomicrobium apsheronum]|uniref:Glycosyltransferase involved in cell wall bisynthesis n=1 Tax=Desulfomicrobium apsheronum TaxID=52560 RepID=A0A1I3NA63_9BACT|nr:glycosyltransferase [Desulfomicrobium apsheronum]SFJ05716.1 Glycosyltransferase involved in cell wall bisynthesis [Desulfomicrobium apsheronum]